jgi:DNA-binding CsgD family transcriptional regulator
MGRLALTHAECGWIKALPEARAAAAVVADVDDPRARVSFWCAFADTLIDAGDTEEARAALRAAAEDAKQSGLAFAEPRVRLLEARLDMLQRRFNRATFRLQQVRSLANDDQDALEAACASGMTLALMQRHTTEPSALHPGAFGSRYLRGQTLVMQALDQAIWGEPSVSRSFVQSAIETWDAPYVRNVARFVEAISERRRGAAGADGLVRAAGSACLDTGDVFHLVCVYRASPELREALISDGTVGAAVREIIARFDPELARRHGFPLAKRPATTNNSLSARETEVLALLTEGLTNREIAARLFIAEATAKLHVRRICAKLGVRSRTEAVLAAVG